MDAMLFVIRLLVCAAAMQPGTRVLRSRDGSAGEGPNRSATGGCNNSLQSRFAGRWQCGL
jgi:hypothetical protein